MWTYTQRSGHLRDAAGHLAGIGYSGAAEHKNDPYSQVIHNLGPLPTGLYTILSPVDTKTHGPYVLWLTPDPANQMFGRSAFGIHGDSLLDPGHASEGCIILARPVRQAIWASGDHTLQVRADDPLPPALQPPSKETPV